MPDHDVIFQQITTDIVKDITPHVALLQSKDCTSKNSFFFAVPQATG